MAATTALTRTYPRTEDIQGRSLTFRLMTPDDGSVVLEFANGLPQEDLVYLRWDITDPDRVAEWTQYIEMGRTSTVLAVEDEKVVGYGSLHHHQLDWSRHLGEMRIMVSPDLRGIGLGRYLGEEILQLARDLKLLRVVVNIASDQPRVRHMFEDMGFQAEALLTDWVIDRNDRTCDLIIMSHLIDR